MKKKRLVIALGGNALGNTPSEQKEKAAACAKVLAELASRGYELILAHGNGPQVGMIHLGLSHAAADGFHLARFLNETEARCSRLAEEIGGGE